VSDQAALIELLTARSLKHGDFQLASGQHSSYYIDARPTTMSAQGQSLIGRMGLRAIRQAGWHPETVGGLTMGADPVAYAIAAASTADPPTIDAFSVRKAAKGHGAQQQIEGNFAAGQDIVVVEDVITSGGSALQAAAVIQDAGGRVQGILSLVDRLQGGRETLEEAGYSVVSLTTIKELGI
jgi:orotate phosphoribosyltransferase